MRATLNALKVQNRVIRALFMREVLTRYGRHNIGFMWLFVEPMIFTLGVTGLWTFVGLHRESPIPIVAFAVTGYSSVLLWRNMPGRCVNAIEPNLSLMYHRYVKVIDIFAARIILEAAGATTSFLVLAAIFIALGWMQAPQDVLKVLFGWLMLMWFGASLAMTVGGMSVRNEVVEKLWHPITYLLFPLSGAAFMVDWMPSAVRDVLLWFPMVHGIEMLRDGYFGSAVHTHYDVGYMGAWCLALSFVGVAQERIVSRRVVPE